MRVATRAPRAWPRAFRVPNQAFLRSREKRQNKLGLFYRLLKNIFSPISIGLCNGLLGERGISLTSASATSYQLPTPPDFLLRVLRHMTCL